MKQEQLLGLYRAMITAREIDRVELELTNRGEAFFHVSGAGHEATAALAAHLIPDDFLHCHYRDKALLLARGLTPRNFFDGLYCNAASTTGGRQISAHLSAPEFRVLCMCGPVGNSALQAVGVAAAVRDQPARPIVLCAQGDGTTQEGEFLEAVSEAVRSRLPVLFLVEDNQWAISTTTAGKTFYSLPEYITAPREFLGRPIHHVDGRDPIGTSETLQAVVAEMRQTREPALVIMHVERLANHTNADDQSVYRGADEIRGAAEQGDPLRNLERSLIERGVPSETLAAIRSEVQQEVAQAEAAAAAGATPVPTFTAKQSIPVELTHPSRERRGSEEAGGLTMREALRQVLRDHLEHDPRVTLYGQDIEDPKGDVFGVTKGLSTAFPGRVLNAPLSESTIVGASIGRALAGERPVAFLQFADFLPLAYNQIAAELGCMYWRSHGGWTAPVIVMIPCGGYRPGLGPFHAHSFESVAAHVPGLDVYLPSTAADAAGLLNAAFRSGRPSLFFYPKALLNDPERVTSNDVPAQFVPIGPARKVRVGRDITLVGWGNTVRICERVGNELEKVGVEAEILDLRTISPWDEQSVLASTAKTARLLVVHEDNHTCGFGSEVLATVAEKTHVPVAMRRVSRPDTHVPCNFANQLSVLPTFQRVLTTAAELLDLDLSWDAVPQPEPGIALIEAIGSGPADETVVVVELHCRAGQTISRGQIVASLEATKSVFELTSPVSGQVEEVFVSEGDTVGVGKPLVRVRTEQEVRRPAPVTQDQPGTPVLTRRPGRRLRISPSVGPHRALEVGISSVAVVSGSRLVGNDELVTRSRGMCAADILKRTGIETRHWIDQGEDAVGMAVKAAWQLLDRERLIIDDLDLVICTTTSPTSVTPSMACQILNGLSSGKTDAMLQAFDINAACSGYIYALQAGYDYLQSTPDGRVLIVTAEVLSPLLDLDDFDTAILFGDAASASILYGESHMDRALARVHRPNLSAKGDDGSTLHVPLLNDGYIRMKGQKVFSEAVRSMIASLNHACSGQGLSVSDLSLIIPHQANQRILDAIQSRVNVDVFSNIRRHGNTSSTSIPLCLQDVLPAAVAGQRLGLCAFGGGFTFGAGILEVLRAGR